MRMGREGDKMSDEYKILGYIDDLENAGSIVQRENLGEDLIKGIESVHDDLVELQPLLQFEEDYQKLKEEVEKPVEELLELCSKGDKGAILKKTEKLQKTVCGSKVAFGVEKARELINGNGFTLISTADKDGKVDIAFAGSATIISDDQLVVANMMLSKTADNLARNKNAVLIGFRLEEDSPMATQVARVYCNLIEDVKGGPLFEQVKEASAKEAGSKVADMINNVYLFKIEDIRIFGGIMM